MGVHKHSAEDRSLRKEKAPRFDDTRERSARGTPTPYPSPQGGRGRDSSAFTESYFANAGVGGSFSTSRASCWMMMVAFRLAAIFFKRSSEATVCARS